jgi:hypothetical protein
MSQDTSGSPQVTAQEQKRRWPLAGVFSGIRGAFARKQSGSGQALAPAPTTDALAAQIEQLSIDANTPVSTIVAMLAGETQDVAQVVQSFDEHKEHPLGKLAALIVTLLCYLLPWLIAAYAGAALGSTYAGRPFVLNDAMTAFYYLVSWAYEFSLVGLMVAMVRQYKRLASKNKGSLVMLIVLIILFVALATASACAQWILFEHRINVHDQAQLIGALFRTLGTPLTDLASAVTLAVLYTITLEQHLDTLRKKTDATIAINRAKLQSRIETVNAALEVKNALQKEQDYQQKNELANTIIGMFSEHAIDAIRESLNGKQQNTGSSYRRDGYR